MTTRLAPQEARARVHGPDEIAFLDVREAGPFSEGHPLFAVPCPWSLFEDRVRRIVPRRDVPVILIDGGDRVADGAADVLTSAGYGDVSTVAGGAPGWAAAGLTLFKGVNVPSKTLGELAEHHWHPATIGPDTLAAWQAEGKQMHFFDTRPPAEYARMKIPGAICLPNGELAYRMPAAADDDAPVVLTCAGRTRGIIGATGLARLYPGREIYALENGTQGWALSGRALLQGNTPDPLPAMDADDMAAARARARDFMAAEAIPQIDAAGISRLQGASDRTAFLIDVRSAEEAAADPLPAFTQALSGQLVQSTDQWIGVRRARVILADDQGLRAALAAFWLKRLGFEPHVALVDNALRALSAPALPDIAIGPVPAAVPHRAFASVKRGAGRFIDVRPSDAYRAGHVAGALWSIRPELRNLRVRSEQHLFLIGDGSARAPLAAQDLTHLGHGKLSIVEGGHEALVAAGAAVEATPNCPEEMQSPDVTWFAHGRHDGDLNASRTYLEWETGLIAQLDAEERAEFAV